MFPAHKIMSLEQGSDLRCPYNIIAQEQCPYNILALVQGSDAPSP